jgi:hypothetical protein
MRSVSRSLQELQTRSFAADASLASSPESLTEALLASVVTQTVAYSAAIDVDVVPAVFRPFCSVGGAATSSANSVPSILTSTVDEPVHLHVSSLHRVPASLQHFPTFRLTATLVHGSRSLAGPQSIEPRGVTSNGLLYPAVCFDETIIWRSVKWSSIPREARVRIVVYGLQVDRESEEIAWATIPVFDVFGRTLLVEQLSGLQRVESDLWENAALDSMCPILSWRWAASPLPSLSVPGLLGAAALKSALGAPSVDAGSGACGPLVLQYARKDSTEPVDVTSMWAWSSSDVGASLGGCSGGIGSTGSGARIVSRSASGASSPPLARSPLALRRPPSASPSVTSSVSSASSPLSVLGLGSVASPTTGYSPSLGGVGESVGGGMTVEAVETSREMTLLLALQRAITRDVEESERATVWLHREFIRERFPEYLMGVVLSVPISRPEEVEQLHVLVDRWPVLKPAHCLSLLTNRCADMYVRATAVRWLLMCATIEDVVDLTPQLVQAVKGEMYASSPLMCFLVFVATRSAECAHALFWSLRSEMYPIPARKDPRLHRTPVYWRLALLGEAVLANCGRRLRGVLLDEVLMTQKWVAVANDLAAAKETQRMLLLKERLLDRGSHSMPVRFHLPTDLGVAIETVLVEKCSYFTSNKVPLRLALQRADAAAQVTTMIFKGGDDLRQDALIQQLIGAMDRIWLSEGLDLHMITYRCAATTLDSGLIEMVENAATLRAIQVKHGVTGSFKDHAIVEWLRERNPNENDYELAASNFAASCAGFCVATYLLGIGDRHNDNIMVTLDGHLFHIDFARVFGHAQKFGAFKRDRAPFVLTSDMLHVIDSRGVAGDSFARFAGMCISAFLAIRRHRGVLLNALVLSLQAGMRKLASIDDVQYVEDNLHLDKDDQTAEALFRRLIEKSLNTKFTQINFFIHNLAHSKQGPTGRTRLRGVMSTSARYTYVCVCDGVML